MSPDCIVSRELNNPEHVQETPIRSYYAILIMSGISIHGIRKIKSSFCVFSCLRNLLQVK